MNPSTNIPSSSTHTHPPNPTSLPQSRLKYDILYAMNLLSHLKDLRYHLHSFYHEAMGPEIQRQGHSIERIQNGTSAAPLTHSDNAPIAPLAKSEHIEKQRQKVMKYKDAVVKDLQTCLRSHNEILQETSDSVVTYKSENAQESALQNIRNQQSRDEIMHEIASWDNGETDLTGRDEETILTHASLYLSQYLKEQWSNIHEIAKHMSQLLSIQIVWNDSMSRLEMNCDNIFMAYVYISDRRKLPLATSLPDQLRQREDDVIMQDLMEKRRKRNEDAMRDDDAEDDDEELNVDRSGSHHMMLHTKTAATMDVNDVTSAFIAREHLSEFYIDHIAVLATHEPAHIFPVSKYAVFRNIQKQLMKAVDYYSGCKGHKTYLLQSVVRYIHSYHRLYEKKTRYSGQLLNSKLIPPQRTFHTYTAVDSEKLGV